MHSARGAQVQICRAHPRSHPYGRGGCRRSLPRTQIPPTRFDVDHRVQEPYHCPFDDPRGGCRGHAPISSQKPEADTGHKQLYRGYVNVIIISGIRLYTTFPSFLCALEPENVILTANIRRVCVAPIYVSQLVITHEFHGNSIHGILTLYCS